MTKFILFHIIIVSSLMVFLAPSTCLSAHELARDGRFIAYDNGIVLDTKTGLEWYAGSDRNTTWNKAKKWVENLNVAGVVWRMPTRNELSALFKKWEGIRNMTPLLKTTGWRVWAGETKGSSAAWGFDFYLGSESWYARDFSHNLRCFAVHSMR